MKRIALFGLGAALHLAGWALWFLWSWLNRFADPYHMTGYHWTAWPMAFGFVFLWLGGAVLAGWAVVEVKP